MKKVRFYSFITIVFALILTTSCASSSVAIDDQTAKKETVDVSTELKKADELFKQRTDIDKLREAVKIINSARNPNQRDFEVEWKYAQYNYFLGKQSDKEKEKEKAFDEGEVAGKIAARMEKEKPDGYFWYAANLGEKAKLSPLTVGLTKVDDIREAMQKVIELQPDFQGASAFDALARIELATDLVGGGKREKAVEYAEKGLEYNKDNSNLRLTLASAYIAVDRDAEAKKQLEYVLTMKPDPGYLPEYEANLAEAKKMLAEKF